MATRTRVFSISLVVVLVALVACSPAPAAPPAGEKAAPASKEQAKAAASPELQALIEGARKEGKLTLVWSEATIGSSQDIRRMADGFNRLYGLNLDIQFTPGPPMAPMAARVVQEYQANRPSSTDVFLSGANDLIPTIENDALQKVNWTSWAPNIQNPDLVALDGMVVEIAAPTVGVAFNSSKLSGDQAPKSMQDLLRPQYKGRIATTAGAFVFDRLASSEIWGESRTLEFMSKFAEQVGGLIGCSEYERLVSGEFDMLALACNTGLARTRQKQGAPLSWVIPSDAAMIQYWYKGVPKTAPHPNAAKLWVNYMLAREAQDIMFDGASLDHFLVPGSKFAEDVQKLESQGIKFHHVGIEFILRNDLKKIRDVSKQLQDMVQKKS